MAKDLIYAFRALRKSAVFAITAIVTIALAIGASTAIFSVTNAVLLRPLPYHDPNRLVLICNDLQRRNVKDFPLSNADFLDLRNGATNAFAGLAAVSTFRGTLQTLDGTPEQLGMAVVSTNFFRLMGVGITAGRDFQDSDGLPQPPSPQGGATGGPPVVPLPVMAILSHQYFERRFGGDRSVIGKTLPAAAGPSQIIAGVLAPGAELLFPPQANMEQFPDVWFAARIPYDSANRNNVQWRVIGRLKPGASVEFAEGETETIARKIRQLNPIARTAGQHFRIEPMKQHLVDEVRPAILALMGAVVFLLLIACANVANLMLVRASLRERELAVRAALGGGWWRLLRQTLAEALLISGVGTAVGIALAELGIHELLAIAPANLPRLNSIHIDPLVLAFSGAVGLVCAALFGVLPALRAASPDLMTTLRTGGRTGSLGATGLLRNIVVVMEVAMAFVLLIGSGLMFRTFLAIQRVDVGFDPHHLLTFQLLGNVGNTGEQRASFKRHLRDRLGAIAGVRSVTASSPLPLAGGFNPVRWGGADALTDPSKFQAADFQVVLPGYFESLHTPLMAGRTFTEADSTPSRSLLIIDQALAAKAFPNQSPQYAIGKRILFRLTTPDAQWGEIIGVVAHQRDVSLAEPGREQLYATDGYTDHNRASWWALRDRGRSQPLCRRRPRRGPQSRRAAVDQPHGNDGLAGSRGPGRYAVFASPDRRLLRYRCAAGGRRAVRRALHRGTPAHGGNWSAYGPRSCAIAHLEPGDWPRSAPQHAGHRGGAGRRLRADPCPDDHAGGRQAHRPYHVRLDRPGVPLDRRRGILAPSPPRGCPGPVRSAARGIAQPSANSPKASPHGRSPESQPGPWPIPTSNRAAPEWR